MTTTCMPRKPLRCWQYRKDQAELVPRWTLPHLGWHDDTDKGPEFIDDGNSSGQFLKDGHWIVELDDGKRTERAIRHYTDEEFREQFEVAT